ncbi:VOC family protein [Streptomyces aureus]|uniref:VOC family protein n=2 Tax=Streptomyces TaxID=1883 RepID=A0ABV4SZL7_9ACTN
MPGPRSRVRRHWRTVKQFADAARPEELSTGQWQNRPSVLDDYKPYLDDRWNEGCTNAWKLWEEIVPLGYKGSYQRVRAYLHKKRTSPRPVVARPPSPRTVAGWILRRPETLPEAEQLQLKTVRTHCPEIDALTRHVPAFAVMLTERQGERLPDWLAAVRRDDLPSLHTLAAGIDRDRDAVIAGLTLPWSSGAVEKWIVRTDQASYRSAMQIVVTLDCVDTEAQADFWLAALSPLDYRRGFHGPPYLSLVGPAPAPTLLLQHVPEPKQGKNRMHLDLDFGTADLVSEVNRLERLGAAKLSEELSEHGFRWIVVADPEGNEFCVFHPPNNINVAR